MHTLFNLFLNKIHTAPEGYLLPVTIMLGLSISTVNLLGLQVIAQNSSTLNNQYYNTVAKEAAQAGTITAAKCIKANTMGWSSSGSPLTPATNCSGTTVAGKPTIIVNNSVLSSTFQVGQLQTVNATSKVVTSTGKGS